MTRIKPKKISIIIPIFNGWTDTKKCIYSILKADYPQDLLEIIVVDNHSTDNSIFYIKKMFPNIKLIEFPQNMGYAKAINKGSQISSGEYIQFGNNDVLYDKDYFNQMILLGQSEKKIGVIAGKAYLTDYPNKLAFKGLRTNPYIGYRVYDLTNINNIRSCEIPPGGGFFVRKSILKKVGLLDEVYFLYFEDVDFCIRVKRNGFKILYNPKAIYYHGSGKTAYRENINKLQIIYYYMYRSKWRCLIKNASFLQIISSLLVQSITIHLDNLQGLPVKTYQPFLKGFVWNIIHFKQTLQSKKETYSSV